MVTANELWLKLNRHGCMSAGSNTGHADTPFPRLFGFHYSRLFFQHGHNK